MSVPYENATSGARARGEITKLLQRFGAESVGFATLLLAFTWRGHQVQLKASARGWADLYLRENPWHARRRYSQKDWDRRALEQGMISVNSPLDPG